ncbi:LysE family translocator [Euzebya tangerina]|uniref:LysE family translocator n=1 Tax=Euzebya tangerina TaxID=591198 RepID=UPI000E31F225|nr:LysE family translocator [Euzebya tangerina]
MPPLSSLASFGLLSLLLIIVPGPSVIFVLSRSVALGRRSGLLSVVGNTIGVSVLILLVAAGLGPMLERSATLFTAMKLIGAAYLGWLGIQAIRNRHEAARVVDVTEMGRTRRSLLAEGFIVGVSNPKALVFFAAILPQYVDPGIGPAGTQMAVLGGLFAVIALVCDGVWALAGGSARAWLLRSPRRLARLGGASGLAMIGLGVGLAVTGRPDSSR